MQLKKILVFILFIPVFSFTIISSVFADAVAPTINNKAYFLMDSDSGAILASNNSQEALPVASITKLMTAYLVLDHIKNGELDWTEMITVSKKTEAINESEMFLAAGETVSVRELFTGIIVMSANDAAHALAEAISGSEAEFVSLMNEKAKALGLNKAEFFTSNGLDVVSPNGETLINKMSSSEIAQLSNNLIKDHPKIIEFTTIINHTFRAGTSKALKVENTNWMLPTLYHAYDGVDGLKTGYTSAAGYCFAGTVQRDNLRLVSVMMGTGTKSSRFNETKKLYDYVYNNFAQKQFLQTGEQIQGYETTQVEGHSNPIQVVPEKDLVIPVQKGQEDQYSFHVVYNNNNSAPLAKGEQVGTVQIYYKGTQVPGTPTVSLVTKTAVAENFMSRFFDF